MIASAERFAQLGRGPVALLRSSMTRSEFFTALSFVGCANGIGARVIQAVADYGWVDAIFYTFDISAIVWMAAVIGIELLSQDDGDRISVSDLLVGVAFLLLTVVPIGGASWLALTALSIYVLRLAATSSSRQRGAMILLAVTVPMLWSRLLFRCFSEIILDIDASLVGRVLGTARAGNVVRFADGSGDLVILPACSSLAGLSLVFLCWVTMSQTVRHRWAPQDVTWYFLAAASVVIINVTRMSLMGLDDWHYQALHSPLGNLATNMITLSLAVGFCMLGLRREILARI